MKSQAPQGAVALGNIRGSEAELLCTCVVGCLCAHAGVFAHVLLCVPVHCCVCLCVAVCACALLCVLVCAGTCLCVLVHARECLYVHMHVHCAGGCACACMYVAFPDCFALTALLF